MDVAVTGLFWQLVMRYNVLGALMWTFVYSVISFFLAISSRYRSWYLIHDNIVECSCNVLFILSVAGYLICVCLWCLVSYQVVLFDRRPRRRGDAEGRLLGEVQPVDCGESVCDGLLVGGGLSAHYHLVYWHQYLLELVCSFYRSHFRFILFHRSVYTMSLSLTLHRSILKIIQIPRIR